MDLETISWSVHPMAIMLTGWIMYKAGNAMIDTYDLIIHLKNRKARS